MQMYEVGALLKNIYKASKNEWEQARLITYVIAQVNSKKKLKLTDITQFAWEKESASQLPKTITDEDIKRLKDKAKSIINNNNI